ncbi:hypothetical protein ElyMa_002540000 [Elysia marginata]|uniref:Uncharacterized protein n=1 Tax=Elysia marginata TaxID=1093978 RepID=A0AAV4GW30_9GAST|nr:hypothetical protein ElyMa_002540000 [Elysia marginata]
MAYDDYAQEKKLTTQGLAFLKAYVDRNGAEGTSFDDLFDDSSYRTAQTTFAGRARLLQPYGQTHYRPNVEYAPQGLPRQACMAHWEYLLPNSSDALRRNVVKARPKTKEYKSASSGRLYSPSSPRKPLPKSEQKPAAAPLPLGPSTRTYNFAG